MSEVPLYRHGRHACMHPHRGYRSTLLIRNQPPVGPYSTTIPRALRRPKGGGRFLMSEVPL